MARLPRYITPGQPQHIIQRGNNRQVIFAAEADYQFFRDAVVEAAGRFGLGKMVSDPIYSINSGAMRTSGRVSTRLRMRIHRLSSGDSLGGLQLRAQRGL